MTTATQYIAEPNEANIRATLDSWRTQHPGMGVLALLPEGQKAVAPLLQEICTEHKIALMGAIFPALLVTDKFRTKGLWLLRFDQAPDYLLLDRLPHTSDGAERVAEEIAGKLRGQLGQDTEEVTLFMLFDGMLPNIATILDELYLHLANRVHYAGANAGSETFTPMPCLFDATRVVGDAVLVMLLKQHHGAILEHGYQLAEQTYTATSTSGNRITHIDWRPAFEVYCELVHARFGVEITRENFYQYSVHFPFGIVRANHNVLVRIPVALADDGALICVGEVPPHSVLALLDPPAAGSRHTVEALAERMTALNRAPLQDRDAMLFYCAGRRLHLGLEEAQAEVQDLQRLSGVRQVLGALSLGEIGASTLWGYPLFHNATIVATLW